MTMPVGWYSPWLVMGAAFIATALLAWLGVRFLQQTSQRYQERFQLSVGQQLQRAHPITLRSIAIQARVAAAHKLVVQPSSAVIEPHDRLRRLLKHEPPIGM